MRAMFTAILAGRPPAPGPLAGPRAPRAPWPRAPPAPRPPPPPPRPLERAGGAGARPPLHLVLRRDVHDERDGPGVVDEVVAHPLGPPGVPFGLVPKQSGVERRLGQDAARRPPGRRPGRPAREGRGH